MLNNSLRTIQEFGQSIWQDFIRRKIILSGELRELIENDGISGVTSNPAIFESAIDGSRDYDDDISAMALQGRSATEIYESLTVRDVQMAADLFRPLYDCSDGRHGFVSLEVNPHLARDVNGTLAEAHRLWKALDRPNVMIKVPATRQGLTCIRRLISQGVNVNVTLLFGLPRYREVAEAFINGLEARAESGRPLKSVASVASFFLSRIDVMVDPALKKLMEAGKSGNETVDRIYGQVAIASARCAYQIFNELFHGGRFRRLAQMGARPQRVLWASTSTKEPEFSDIKYVEALIGPDTINTLPRKTIDAYRAQGRPARRLDRDPEQAWEILTQLARLDINIDKVTQTLVEQGIEKFVKPYDRTLQTLEKARRTALQAPMDRQTLSVADDILNRIKERIAQLQRLNFTHRLWEKDASLWPHDPGKERTITGALGWLDVVPRMHEAAEALAAFRNELLEDGFRHVLHMGMGGSSLAPMVFQRCFPAAGDGLALTVLDTTDPATVTDCAHRLPLSRTLFIVASKSGTTAESLAFEAYFFDQLERIQDEAAGTHFVAITDPGTPLADLARERNYRRSFLNFEDIGGRYSALSFFGMVPAALLGLDIAEMMTRAQRMLRACGPDKPVEKSPGVALGAALGELALQGYDKVTLIAPPGLAALGMWLEQLMAESTGKGGAGLLPVAGEPLAPPAFYGSDRVFVHIRLENEPDERLARSVSALRHAGHPVITIRMKDRLDLAQEFIRWEIATATAGAVLGINPFDQPNVQESKDNTDRLLDTVRDKGRLPDQTPRLTEGPLKVYLPSGPSEPTLIRSLARFFEQVRHGDYIALLAYLTEEAAVGTLLNSIRLRLQQHFKTPVTMGYGPRYLHSTGQFHKGGPGTGLFVQLTADDRGDLDIPGRPYGFGILRRAQARGDLEALDRHGRRVLRVHLGADAARGLGELTLLLENVLPGIEAHEAMG
jgi:transaldolase/glucose-6-phosphate isomerase